MIFEEKEGNDEGDVTARTALNNSNTIISLKAFHISIGLTKNQAKSFEENSFVANNTHNNIARLKEKSVDIRIEINKKLYKRNCNCKQHSEITVDRFTRYEANESFFFPP